MRISRQNKTKKNYFFDLYATDIKVKATTSSVPLPFILTRRTVIFFFLYLIATTIFFFIGNYQEFLDANLAIILKVAIFSAIALFCFSFALIAESIICMVKKRKDYIYYSVHIFVMLILIATSTAFILAYQTLDILSKGIK